jgi:hypothetical protein
VVTAQEAEQSTAVLKAANVVWQELAGTVRAVGFELVREAAAGGDLTGSIRQAFRAGREWVSTHRDLIVLGAKVAGGLVATSAALLVLAPLLKVAALGFTLTSAAVGLLGGAIGFLLTPIGLVAAAVAGLGTLFATQTAAGERMTSRLASGFSSFGDTARATWGAVSDALKRGDMEGAFKVVGAGLRLEWAKVVGYWTEKWLNFKGSFEEGWEDTTTWLAKKLSYLVDTSGATADEIERGEAAAKKDRERRRKADIDEAERDKKRAEDDFKKLTTPTTGSTLFGRSLAAIASAAGRARSDTPDAGGVGPAARGGAMAAWKPSFLTNLFQGAKGIFAGPSGQQLGYGDNVGQRQLDAQKGIERNTKATTDAVVALARAFVFK